MKPFIAALAILSLGLAARAEEPKKADPKPAAADKACCKDKKAADKKACCKDAKACDKDKKECPKEAPKK